MDNSHECCRHVKDVSLKDLRDRLAEFAKVRGWEQYHSPRNLLLALVCLPSSLNTHPKVPKFKTSH